jgi:hypothetical protein
MSHVHILTDRVCPLVNQSKKEQYNHLRVHENILPVLFKFFYPIPLSLIDLL